MIVLKDKIKKEELEAPFTKAVIDVKKEILSIGCELHIDCAEELVKDGSATGDLWGINIYPDWRINFISLINIRPRDGNRRLEIQNGELKDKIKKIVERFRSE